MQARATNDSVAVVTYFGTLPRIRLMGMAWLATRVITTGSVNSRSIASRPCIQVPHRGSRNDGNHTKENHSNRRPEPAIEELERRDEHEKLGHHGLEAGPPLSQREDEGEHPDQH